jgi:poly-beta-1,6-N-acetyl-D-glucosamine synthase
VAYCAALKQTILFPQGCTGLWGLGNPMKSSLLSIKNALFLAVLYVLSFAVFYMAYSTNYTPIAELSDVRLAIFILLSPIIIKYIVQLSMLPFYSLIERCREKASIKSAPKTVSVLIPAYNEEVGIIKTIKSVLNSNYQQLEVIVINDGSSDSTDQLVTEFLSEHKTSDIQLKYLLLKNGGKARALNEGLKLASGEIVFTVDADCVIDKHSVRNMVKRFTDDKVAAVAGNVIVGNRRKSIEIMQQLEYLYGFFFRRADSVFNSVYIIGGAAAAYRKDVLIELGGFDVDIITEDIEMSIRILANGYKTRYAADAVVFTEGPSDFNGLCNQRLRWKFGRILTFIKHRKMFFNLSKQHSPYLTFLLLPVAVYAEIVLLFEAVLITACYAYTFYTNDYLPLAYMVAFLTSMITLQVITDSQKRFQANLLILAPVAWLLFYLVDVIEFQALYRSLKRLIKREELQWQKWSRVGLLSQSIVQSEPLSESE